MLSHLLPDPPSNLIGHFLMASPLLQETIFEKSCILITQSSSGHEGYILNHKTDLTLGSVLKQTENTPLEHLTLHLGGPVDTESINFLILRKSPSGKFLYRTNASMEQCEMALHEPDARIVPCLGYSGWSQGQLEQEFEHHSWFHSKPDSQFTEHELDISLWNKLMEQQGPYHELITKSPGNPMKN